MLENWSLSAGVLELDIMQLDVSLDLLNGFFLLSGPIIGDVHTVFQGLPIGLNHLEIVAGCHFGQPKAGQEEQITTSLHPRKHNGIDGGIQLQDIHHASPN